MKPALLACVLAMGTAAFGQSESLAVLDESPDSPVTVSGNLNCPKERKSDLSGEITFTNRSAKNIVQLEVEAIVKCQGRAAETVKFQNNSLFFTEHGLSSGEKITRPFELGSEDSAVSNVTTDGSGIDAKTLFVQFEDGLTWGDLIFLFELRERRKANEELLTQLASTTSDSEFERMLAEAMSGARSPHGYSFAYKISMVRERSGTPAARADVREKLRIGTTREARRLF